MLAVGRLSKLHGRNEAELAAVAIDAAQHKGLGTELFRRLIQLARDEKLAKVVSNMLPENRELPVHPDPTGDLPGPLRSERV